jgi:Histone methylation protein DOT1
VPAELIVALVLGSEPLPYGPGQEGELRQGRNAYGTTPLAMIRTALSLLELGPGDTFYDLGSGIGLPTLIAALSSEATCRGVEYHRCYVERAEENARGLGLSAIEYRCGDVCAIDWSDGNKFYVSNPFPGDVMGRVAARLLDIARHRPIRVVCFATGLPAQGFRKLREEGRLALFGASPRSLDQRSD